MTFLLVLLVVVGLIEFAIWRYRRAVRRWDRDERQWLHGGPEYFRAMR